MSLLQEIDRLLKGYPGIFGDALPLLETLKEIQKLNQGFSGSFFYLGRDALETAENFTRVHVEHYRQQERPSLPGLAIHHAERLGLDKNSPEYAALILVAVRAEMQVVAAPEYHNQFHFMDVAAMAANLLEKNNEMAKAGMAGAVPLTKKEQALVLIAALAHDLDHEGSENPEGQPIFNEQKSFDAVEPLLKTVGILDVDIGKIHVMLVTTSPHGPHAILKASAQAQREGYEADFSILDPHNKFPELKALSEDRGLVQMAAIVSDADLYPSGGAGMKSNKLMSKLFTSEKKKKDAKIDFTSDSARKFFLDKVIGQEGFTSDAGRAAINGSFEAMRAETDRRLAAKDGKKPPSSSIY